MFKDSSVKKLIEEFNANVTLRHQNVVQVITIEIHSSRDAILHKLSEIDAQQRELLKTLQTLTGKAAEVHGENTVRANDEVERYGRSLEEFAGEVVTDLPRPPRGLTGRG